MSGDRTLEDELDMLLAPGRWIAADRAYWKQAAERSAGAVCAVRAIRRYAEGDGGPVAREVLRILTDHGCGSEEAA